MKLLIICLSLIIGFTATAESPVEVEPSLLEALFAQSGKLNAAGAYNPDGKLSKVLGQSMGYATYSEDVEVKTTHSCDYQNSSWSCVFSIYSISKEGNRVISESATLIRYNAKFARNVSRVKISNVRVDYAG